MNISYLNSKLKEYYTKDWAEVLKSDEPGWILDDKLVAESCSKINASPHFATLYSKRFRYRIGEFSTRKKSYLQLAYAESVKRTLNNCLERMKLSYREEDTLTVLDSTNYNYRNPNSIREESRLGCRNNPDYFKVKHVIIELESEKEKLHETFWKNLPEIALITS